MMRFNNATHAFTVASLMVLFFLPAFGQSNQPRGVLPGGSPDRMGVDEVFDRLNLTAAQKQKIDAIRNSARQRNRSLEQQLMGKEHELQAAFQNGNFNEALATRKLTEMAPIQARLMGEDFRVRSEIMAVLNPQQKSQFQKFEEQARREMPEQGTSRSQ